MSQSRYIIQNPAMTIADDNRFVLDTLFFSEYEGRQPNWKSTIAYVTYLRTYSRPIYDGVGNFVRNEEFCDTLKRVTEGTFSWLKQIVKNNGQYWDDVEAQDKAKKFFLGMWEFKWLPPGRGLWMMGTDYVEKRGGAALNNCGYVTTEFISQDFAEPFVTLMDYSMLGVGMGFDVRGAGTITIQRPFFRDENYVIADSKEGWVDALKITLNAFVGKESLPHFDFSKIRGEGAIIKGFGGVSSGPKPLIELIEFIVTELSALENKRITTTVIVDIMNCIGRCVVAGNVRRSSEIAIGFHNNDEFLSLKDNSNLMTLSAQKSEIEKNHIWARAYTEEIINKEKKIFNLSVLDPKYIETKTRIASLLNDRKNTLSKDETWSEIIDQINNLPLIHHRWASNNTVFIDDSDDINDRDLFDLGSADLEALAKQTATNGEPGYASLKTIRAYGRLVDPPNWKDYRVKGFNPCVTGDTLIAVADGRQAVHISVLVAKGKDVPVFCINPKTGRNHVRWGRNPRKTGEQVQILKVELDDGSFIRVTENHKFIMRNGTQCEAKFLKKGSSLMPFGKGRYINNNRDDWWIDDFTGHRGKRLESHTVVEFTQGRDPIKFPVEVVHHINENHWDNNWQNLEIKFNTEHSQEHSEGMQNAMFGKTHSETTKQKIGASSLERWQDPNYVKNVKEKISEGVRNSSKFNNIGKYERSEEQLKAIAEIGRAQYKERLTVNCLSCKEEMVVIKENYEADFTVALCSYACTNTYETGKSTRVRKQEYLNTESGKEHITRAGKTSVLNKALRQGKWMIERFGSINPNTWDSLKKTYKFETGAFNAISAKVIEENFNNWEEFETEATNFNHKVVAVHLDNIEDVYNITVDEFHNYAVITNEHYKQRNNANEKMSGIFIANCGEQSLEHMELCCLVETFPTNHDTLEDYKQTLKFAYLYAKVVTCITTHNTKTNAVMGRNRRIGTSQAGIMRMYLEQGMSECIRWWDAGYKFLKQLDEDYSGWMGVPASIKITSVKPGGTIPLLVGEEGGMKSTISEYYMRTIRMDHNSSLVKVLANAGFRVEPDQTTPRSSVVYFPVHSPSKRYAKDITIWEQMALLVNLQTYWSDNMVSATITFQPHEAQDIARVLEIYKGKFKAVSFLPYSDHQYAQAPYIPCTKEEYEYAMSKISKIDFSAIDNSSVHEVVAEDKFCSSDKCEI